MCYLCKYRGEGRGCNILSGNSVTPDTLSARILSEKDLSVLSNWLKLAAKSETIEEFTKNM